MIHANVVEFFFRFGDAHDFAIQYGVDRGNEHGASVECVKCRTRWDPTYWSEETGINVDILEKCRPCNVDILEKCKP